MESIRKDVECTFGILKQRFAILKNKFCLHDMEKISDVFASCCILHNMIHQWDGYDDWEAVEAHVRQMEEEANIETGDAITMRERGTYMDLSNNDGEVEVDDDFDTRRAHLIEHFMYLHSNRYNVNRIR